jgi:cytochrome c oxidase subunit 4
MTATTDLPEHHVDDPGAHGDHGHGKAHPTDLQYLYIAVFLAALTTAEVLLYYYPPAFMVMVALLGALAVVKFATVAMFFMHLRFDSRVFRYFFVSGIVLAVVVYTIVLSTFHIWSGSGPPP